MWCFACPTCGGKRTPALARACVYCGARLERSRGLAAAQFAANAGDKLARDFSATSSRYGDEDGGRSLFPVAWTGFGSSAALLSASDQELALDRLFLFSESGRATRWGVSQRLASGLPLKVHDCLVAPPLALRLGTALVTTEAVRFYPHEDPHLASPGGPREWTVSPDDEAICAAAVSAEGDLFLATARTGGGVTVRAVDGSALAQVKDVAVAPGRGLGMAIQQAKGSGDLPGGFVAWLWTDGWLYRLSLGAHSDPATQIRLEDLVAPPLLWHDRLKGSSPVAWHGWRCAATGVYPILGPEGDRATLFGLNLTEDPPRMVSYGEGPFVAVAAESSQYCLVVRPDRLRVLDPFSGRVVAEEEIQVADGMVCIGTSAGTFVALQRSDGRPVLRGLKVRRGASISEAFEAPLRVRRSAEPLRIDPSLAPLETDEGLLVGLEEAAGAAAGLRLWHAVTPFASSRP